MTALSINTAPANTVGKLPEIPSVDWSFMVVFLAVVSVGIIMVASASVTFAATNYGDPWYFLKRHLIYLALGFVGGVLVFSLPVSLWRQYGWLLLLCATFLLVLVLIPGIGREVNGSQRWLVLGPITVQASELVKMCAIIYFASYFDAGKDRLQQNWRGLLVPLLVLASLVVLLLMEPDFGSAVVLSITVIAMLFIAGVKLWKFILLSILAGAGLALMALLSPYRMQRLVSFLDPWADQFNSGYQLTQSLIAFGRGEWLGVGLGNSVQKLFYLPEAHTDFIFAIIAEEFGLAGCLFVIAGFVLMITKILRISQQAIQKQNLFIGFSAFGIGILLATQVVINIGVASGLLPTKGLTLPFISYGGSSLIVSCGLIAFLLRVNWELQNTPDPALVKKKRGKRNG